MEAIINYQGYVGNTRQPKLTPTGQNVYRLSIKKGQLQWSLIHSVSSVLRVHADIKALLECVLATTLSYLDAVSPKNNILAADRSLACISSFQTHSTSQTWNLSEKIAWLQVLCNSSLSRLHFLTSGSCRFQIQLYRCFLHKLLM